jgi:hypothetical protein
MAASSIGSRRRSLATGQIAHGPAGQCIPVGDLDLGQLRRIQGGVLLVQFGDQIQVGDQGAQLRRRAHVELGALVQVEGLVQAVGLDAQQGALVREFVEREAVQHFR